MNNSIESITRSMVENVRMLDKYSNNHSIGTLYITVTHIIFVDSNGKKQIWILNTHIASVEKLPLSTTGSPLLIKCKNFFVVTFIIAKERDCHEVYLTLLKLSSPASMEDLYCFHYREAWAQQLGWNLFNVQREFQRQGAPNEEWSISYLNTNYELCETYPRCLFVPTTCTTSVLVGSAKFRSKGRLPVLTYLHKNKAAICRCSQPLSGFNARCPEDEQMLYNILCTNTNAKYIYVVDTRPRINAMANRAAGKGYENENFYDNIKFKFFGIENIHVMRASLNKLIDLQKSTSMSSFLTGLESSGWLKHIKSILETSWFIAQAVSNGISVVVHCSDGWDRTAQVCSLAALLLDPFYRSIQGFQILIEKDWLSFGHKFNDRCGHIISDSKELAPIFTQFIDCTYQLLQQYPYAFQFNEVFLLTLHDHVNSCQYGTFVGNCEKERQKFKLTEKTYSFTGYISKHLNEYINPFYRKNVTDKEMNAVLQPKLAPQSIILWRGLYYRFENGIHPRETFDEHMHILHDHKNSIEDHVKLLIRRMNSLGKLFTINNVPMKDEHFKFDKNLTEFFSEKIINNLEEDEDKLFVTLKANQLEKEMKAVALDWKFSRNISECICSASFDVFNRKYHCFSCGNIFCLKCMGVERILVGHESQRPVPTCKGCSRKSTVSSPVRS
ncbi:myotubularin-related protein 8 [Leptopilina boulardi]|uniref:myotubularin-related protein 8 n=1 Tax=Leptopilina boulardi TaxID=63433 RepID=UPI0021F65565|nr:myotubularin-related protein 8 [Leptopilina boulardi]